MKSCTKKQFVKCNDSRECKRFFYAKVISTVRQSNLETDSENYEHAECRRNFFEFGSTVSISFKPKRQTADFKLKGAVNRGFYKLGSCFTTKCEMTVRQNLVLLV